MLSQKYKNLNLSFL